MKMTCTKQKKQVNVPQGRRIQSRKLWAYMWAFGVVLSLGCLGGCIDKATRICKDNDNCQLTIEPTVCFQKRCVPRLCEPGQVQTCYTGPKDSKDKGNCSSGVQLCILNGSAWTPCLGQKLPGKEVCDGLDNNCDGQVDEAENCGCLPGQSRACSFGKEGKDVKGNCIEGMQYCTSSKKWGACVGAFTPQKRFTELLSKADSEEKKKVLISSCLEMDRDCNGELDADRYCPCKAGQERPCYLGPVGSKDRGTCKSGKQRCVKGSGEQWNWGFCEGQKLPSLEEKGGCNDLDDDCDGKIDNQSQRETPLWKSCGALNDCKIKYCKNGSWSLCEKQELCGNQLDDDCDGSLDEKECMGL